MTKEAAPATSWGDLAAERDTLIDALVAVQTFMEALHKLDNTAYKGDARRAVDAARGRMNETMKNAATVINKYRR